MAQFRPMEVDPRHIRFSQVTVGEYVFPHTPVLSWKNTYTLPLNVIQLDQKLWLTLDNRRLFWAVTSGIEQNPHLKVIVNVHQPTAACDLDTADLTALAWEGRDEETQTTGLYLLTLRSITWRAAIISRCAKQSKQFPLDGSLEVPPCQQHRQRVLEQWKIKHPEPLSIIRKENTDWIEKVRMLPLVMVQTQAGVNVLHERKDFPQFLAEHSGEFYCENFTFQPNASFVLRTEGISNEEDFSYDDEGETDLLLAELLDLIEFEWVDQQLSGNR